MTAPLVGWTPLASRITLPAVWLLCPLLPVSAFCVVAHGMLLCIILAEWVVNLPAAFITHYIPGYTQTVLIEPRGEGWYVFDWCGEKVGMGYVKAK
jgi:hypothetical protein